MAQEASSDAGKALTIIWVLVGITFLFVILRLYTRISITGAYGFDDYCYNISFVSFHHAIPLDEYVPMCQQPPIWAALSEAQLSYVIILYN